MIAEMFRPTFPPPRFGGFDWGGGLEEVGGLLHRGEAKAYFRFPFWKKTKKKKCPRNETRKWSPPSPSGRFAPLGNRVLRKRQNALLAPLRRGGRKDEETRHGVLGAASDRFFFGRRAKDTFT